MGYQLNQLMKQYGVATPTMAGYTGVSAPGSAPVESAYTGAEGSPGNADKYKTDKAAFDEQLRKYQLDTKSYDQYTKAYQDRLAGTNMYNQAQFSTTGANVPAITTFSQMQKHALGYGTPPGPISVAGMSPEQKAALYNQKISEGMSDAEVRAIANAAYGRQTDENWDALRGIAKDLPQGNYNLPKLQNQSFVPTASVTGFGIGQERANQNIRNWFAANPNATPDELADVKQRYGVNDYDIRNALGTGTRYGTPQWTDTVQGPYYGVAPLSLGNKTAQEKADFYLNQRGIGYTDADIRTGAEKNFGKLPDADWTSLLNLAYPQYKSAVEAAYSNIGRSGFGSNVTNVDNPGYNYWMNQLSTGAVKPENLNKAVYDAANTWMPTLSYDASKLPSQFDWGYYVNKYPDLLKAGIDTQFEAARHYYNSGQAEGRSPYEGWVAAPTVTIPTTPTGSTTTNNSTVNTGQTTPVIYDEPVTPIYNGRVGRNRDFYDDKVQLFAEGGAVKTHYQTGGRTALGYESPEAEADWQRYWESQQSPVETFPVPSEGSPEVAARAAPVAPLTVVANEQAAPVEPLPPPPVTTPAASAETPATSTTTPSAAETPRPALDARTAGLQMLLEKYGPQEGGYAQEVAAARQRAQAETTAFTTMLEKMMNSPEDERTSKAEMYFRLAAAFGSPTKTGQFTENLALAGKELGEYAKGKRESSAKKRDLMLEVQKMKMGAAKDDLAAVRALEAEAMKDRRAIAQELIKEYIASGKPQSDAGKQAMDMGLRPGTPEYQAKVQELAEFNVSRQMAGINNQLAQLTLAQANLTLRQQQAARLSPTEIKMLSEGEDLVASGKQALADLREAYRLNPNSLAGGWLEKGQQFLFEAAGSNDPTIVNTRVINNLLGAQGLAKLRATFGGNPTEGERAILLELEGIGSKTREERATIVRRAYRVLQDRVAREQQRVDALRSGAYRVTEPLTTGEQ